MPQTVDPPAMSPLTVLHEEERLFQSSVRQFAKERLAPHVRAMDEAGQFRKDLLHEMFELGLMGIDIKEGYGGQGGSFFQSILAIEELAKVDPAASVIVDVQNTLVSNAVEAWGTAEQKKNYLSRLATKSVGAYALSEPASGSDAFALTTKAKATPDGYLLTGRKLWITNAAEADIFLCLRHHRPRRRLQRHHLLPGRTRHERASASVRKKTNSASALPPPAN